MKSVAVIGAKGYVGSALVAALSRSPKKYSVIAVTRENYADAQRGTFDIIINAAMPSARFKAKSDPAWDHKETVQKTADIIRDWNYKKFVQISTVSARAQLDTVYGKHKAEAEKLVDPSKNLIVRLGPMYSSGLKKGVLIDMVEGKPVFVAGESRYCFAPLEFVAEWIAENLHRTGVVEVGAKNAITLREVAEHIGGDITFEGSVDHQEIVNPEENFPDARDVLKFIDGLIH